MARRIQPIRWILPPPGQWRCLLCCREQRCYFLRDQQLRRTLSSARFPAFPIFATPVGPLLATPWLSPVAVSNWFPPPTISMAKLFGPRSSPRATSKSALRLRLAIPALFLPTALPCFWPIPPWVPHPPVWVPPEWAWAQKAFPARCSPWTPTTTRAIRPFLTWLLVVAKLVYLASLGST